jgi:hypothetical protein
MYDYRDYGEPNRVRIIPGTINSHIIILFDIYVDLLASYGSCNSIVPTTDFGQVFEFHFSWPVESFYALRRQLIKPPLQHRSTVESTYL